MKGKVNCTCGWSWNKSDSSAKDMYICHECGRDNSNNMKNGGWLDNYNDSQASAPEGMIGDGYSNVGRNSSPAWGGQFEEGGEIPMAQSGRATRQDSLDVYNNAKLLEDYFKKQKYTKTFLKPSEFTLKRINNLKKDIKETKNRKIENLPYIDRKEEERAKQEELKMLNKYLNDVTSDLNKEKKNIKNKTDVNKYLSNLEQSRQDFNKRKITQARHIDEQGKKVDTKILPEQYYNSINDNQFYQRESSSGNIDLRSPMALYDKRITPQSFTIYDSPDLIKLDALQSKLYNTNDTNKSRVIVKQIDALEKDPQFNTDRVEMYQYDPLAVMPFDMVPPEQQEERVRKYGPSGVPKSVLDLHPEWVAPVADTNVVSIQDPIQVSRQKLDSVNIAPAGLVQTPLNISAPLPNIVNTPKSYNVSMQRYNMQGPDDYYQTNQKGISYEKAMQIKAASDAYNKEIEKKYGPQNEYETPKSAKDAAERLNQLRQEFNMTPNYEMGGSIPGAVGFTYARTKGIPSEGPYAKKTMPSAQNGQEMKFYQEGLDWKPKTISRNGSWLNKYEQAQDGKKKFKLKDERLQAIRPSESTFVKKPNFAEERAKVERTYATQAGRQMAEEKRRSKLTKEQREREDYNAMSQQTGSIQTPVEESTWDRSKAIVSNPLTAFGYAARNESLPTRFQYGDRNTLDYAVDWVNPLQGIASASEIPAELGRGEYLNAGLSALDALDLGVYAKGARKALRTKSGLLSNAYKINPWAFKPNESNYYRQVSKEAIDDALSSKLIREKGEEVSSENYAKFQDQLEDLSGTKEYLNHEDKYRAMNNNAHGPMPYFQKGELFYGNKPTLSIREKGVPLKERKKVNLDYLIESNYSPENFQNSYGYKMSLGNPEEVGSVGILKPNPELRNLENFNLYKKHWLKGYKQIPKKENGGIIKDDRGQWTHPGEITEIGSNQITMEGVPYDVLGISDTGDVKLMKPGKNYKFKGKKVTEFPVAKNGLRQEQKGLQNLDNLINFTNYNTKQSGGWLDQY